MLWVRILCLILRLSHTSEVPFTGTPSATPTTQAFFYPIRVDWTTVSSLCAVVAASLPQRATPTDHVFTWPQVLRHMPWELIMVRLGGSALQVIAEASVAPSWLLETVLLENMDTRTHSAWCLVALMAATALVCEVDSVAAGPRLVYKLIHLSERFKLHPLYFALPVVMQSRCVMLVPYTSTPLVFLHLYAPIRSAELYWLGLLLKAILCVNLVIAASTVLLV
ncbi:solute carrier family 13 member 2-like isoform X1 [Rhipicephalus microplus]|uniref:solute carrier family 13 member 2-like isoform X1 n=1 Tax=Rhipicephalus microplus TaxID=6941 RepID=UPI003F6CB9A8